MEECHFFRTEVATRREGQGAPAATCKSRASFELCATKQGWHHKREGVALGRFVSALVVLLPLAWLLLMSIPAATSHYNRKLTSSVQLVAVCVEFVNVVSCLLANVARPIFVSMQHARRTSSLAALGIHTPSVKQPSNRLKLSQTSWTASQPDPR
jgi:hypothetical protein